MRKGLVVEKTIDSFYIIFNDEDEWPARISEFIINMCHWCLSESCSPGIDPGDLASFFEDIAFSKIEDHLLCTDSSHTSPTGQTEYTVNSSVNLDDICRDVARAAFEKCVLTILLLDIYGHHPSRFPPSYWRANPN